MKNNGFEPQEQLESPEEQRGEQGRENIVSHFILHLSHLFYTGQLRAVELSPPPPLFFLTGLYFLLYCTICRLL